MHFHGKSSRREEVEWNVHVIRDKEKTKRRMEIKAEERISELGGKIK